MNHTCFSGSWARRDFIGTGIKAAALLAWPWKDQGLASLESAVAVTAGEIEARRREFLRFWGITVTPNDGIGSKCHPAVRGIGANSWNNLFYVIPQLAMEHAEPGSVAKLSGVTEYLWPRSMDFIARRADCSDFVMHAALRMLRLYPDSPLLSGEKREDLKKAVRNFVYWNDEPEEHKGVMFTENHQIMFSAAELLAGELYPSEIFSVVQQPGTWRAARAKPRVLRWLEWRARFGFSEWLSQHYYEEDMVPLLNLAQFAQDAEVREKAALVLNLMVFEMATNSLHGNFTATQGRIYSHAVLRPSRSFTSPIRYMLWGQGSFDQLLSMCGVCLATSPFTPPQILLNIARDVPDEMENRQRSSLTYEEAIKFGIDPADVANYPLFNSLGYAFHLPYLEHSLKFLNPERPEGKNAENKARAQRKTFTPETTLPPENYIYPRVDPYTYRTPDYMLSCAQDWLKGRQGYQHHIWHAALRGEAGVFTNNLHPEKSARVDRWAGNGSLPKAVAHRNVLIALYRVAPGAPAQTATHAWFPRFAFDEVEERDGWVFGRKEGGFVALRSLLPAVWLEPDLGWLKRAGFEAISPAPYDYLAEGAENAWICELGNATSHGSFTRFVDTIAASKLEGGVESITYRSPSAGTVECGWNLPLKINGKEIPIRHPLRFSNPYCQAEFGSGTHEIRFQNERLVLDIHAL